MTPPRRPRPAGPVPHGSRARARSHKVAEPRDALLLNVDYMNQTAGGGEGGASSRVVATAERAWAGVVKTVAGARYKLMVGQADVRTYLPFSNAARDEAPKGERAP